MTRPARLARWVPARLDGMAVVILTVALGWIAAGRAWDYATPPPWVTANPRSSPGLAITEAAAPLWLWITWLTVGSVVLLGSAAARIHVGVAAGHAILLPVYVGLATGITIEYAVHPWLDGVRSAGPLWLVVLLHLLLLSRTGWRPRA